MKAERFKGFESTQAAVPEWRSPRMASCARLTVKIGTKRAAVVKKLIASRSIGACILSLRFKAREPFKISTATRACIHQRRVRHQAKFSLVSMLVSPMRQPCSRRGISEIVLVFMVILLYNAQKDIFQVLGFTPKLAYRDSPT